MEGLLDQEWRKGTTPVHSLHAHFSLYLYTQEPSRCILLVLAVQSLVFAAGHGMLS